MLLGSLGVKVARKHVDEIDPWWSCLEMSKNKSDKKIDEKKSKSIRFALLLGRENEISFLLLFCTSLPNFLFFINSNNNFLVTRLDDRQKSHTVNVITLELGICDHINQMITIIDVFSKF